MPYQYINVTMELLCSAVLLVLIFSQLQKKRKTRQDYLFLLFSFAQLGYTLSDAAAWGFDRMPGTIPYILNSVGSFLAFFLGAMVSFFLMAYIITSVSQKTGISIWSNKLLWIMGALILLLIATTILNLFNGMFYTIDQNNTYHWGDWDPFSYFIVLTQNILLIVQILLYRKYLDRRDFWFFLLYCLLPSAAVLFGFWQPKLMLTVPAAVISLLMIYVNVQQEQEKRLSQQELELANSRTAIMLSQIQPHFLYNTLTAIDKLCYDNPKAHTAILTFSAYLRGNLDSLSRKNLIPFESEWEHIRQYLWLEELRFGKKLRVVYDVETVDFMLPALSLQPLVENAVRYGVTKKHEGGTVTIHTEETGRGVLIVVSDDGVGFDLKKPQRDGRSHTGIPNVRARLAAMCDGTLTMKSTPGVGTTAVIEIPRKGTKT